MTSRLIILDPSLQDYGGHYYNLDVGVALAARRLGLAPVIFAHRDLLAAIEAHGLEIVRWFHRPFWAFAAEVPTDPASFSALTHDALVSVQASRADHVFVPTAGGKDLADILVAMGRLGSAQQPAWHIMLHYAPDDSTMQVMLHQPVLPLLAELVAAGSGRVWFYATTPDLAGLYHHVTRTPVAPTFLPAGLVPGPRLEECASAGPLHVVMLGSARPAKGYGAIPSLISRLYESHIVTGALRFTIHAVRRRADPIAALESLQTYRNSAVRLIRDILTSRAYFDLLASADIVLLPYAEFYRTSGSSVLTEALIAGKPIVIPEGMPQGHAVGPDQKVTIADPGELADAVLRIVGDYPRYCAAARAAAPFWRRRHSPEALLAAMLQAAGTGPA